MKARLNTITADDLKILLERHQAYLDSKLAVGSAVQLIRLDLRGVDFTNYSLSLADLSYSDLRKSNLTGVDIRGTILVGANLIGAKGLTASMLAQSLFLNTRLSQKLHLEMFGERRPRFRARRPKFTLSTVLKKPKPNDF